MGFVGAVAMLVVGAILFLFVAVPRATRREDARVERAREAYREGGEAK